MNWEAPWKSRETSQEATRVSRQRRGGLDEGSRKGDRDKVGSFEMYLVIKGRELNVGA